MPLFPCMPSPGDPPGPWPTPAKLGLFLAVYLGQHTPVGFTWLALPEILLLSFSDPIDYERKSHDG